MDVEMLLHLEVSARVIRMKKSRIRHDDYRVRFFAAQKVGKEEELEYYYEPLVYKL